MSGQVRRRRARSLFHDRAFSRTVLEAGAIAAACLVLNELLVPGIQWWPLLWVLLALSVGREAVNARRRLRQDESTPPAGGEEALLEEAHLLREAVQELADGLTPDQRDLLGDVAWSLSTLERRADSLVAQARDVDAALSIHDEQRLARDVDVALARVAAARSEAERADEQAALDVLERQRAALDRVHAHRARIEARLRTCVGMMRALHLDLVALRSSDVGGDSAALRRLGEQVREVGRGVEALAGATDELFLEDLGRLGATRPRAGASRSEPAGTTPRGRRERS